MQEDELRTQILQFLYDQVQQNKIPQIKKGQVEDFLSFINNILADKEAKQIETRMMNSLNNIKKEDKDETNT